MPAFTGNLRKEVPQPPENAEKEALAGVSELFEKPVAPVTPAEEDKNLIPEPTSPPQNTEAPKTEAPSKNSEQPTPGNSDVTVKGDTGNAETWQAVLEQSKSI